MKASIIVPVNDDSPAVCLDLWRVKHMLRPGDELVIVDNTPQISTALMKIAQDTNAQNVREPEPGAYTARRTGVSVSKNPLLVFLDSDCTPTDDWLERGRGWITRGYDYVAGRVETHKGTGGLVERYDHVTAIPQGLLEVSRRLCMGNLFMTRDLYDRIGGFDPQRKSGPDRGLVDRIKHEARHAVYDGGLKVTHPPRTTWASILKKQRRMAVSTRLQDHRAMLSKRIIRAFLPWWPLHKRIWAKAEGLDKVRFSLTAQGLKLYWLLHYLKGGEEPA